MAFPAKTDRARILAVAMDQIAREGMQQLSLRSLAATLDLAPNALYRYFPSRAQLGADITTEITRRVHTGLQKAAGRKPPERAVRALARAYVLFAREQSHLYAAFLTPCLPTPGGQAAHTALWDLVLQQVARISGPEKAVEAAVGLWAFLHGFVELHRAGAFDEGKPLSGFEWGLDAWFKAARIDPPRPSG